VVKLAQAVFVFKLHDSGGTECLPEPVAVDAAPQLAAPAARMPPAEKCMSAQRINLAG
jgi:hypothetical protein